MARLYMFAEGDTEQVFASNVLVEYLAQFGVYLHKPVLVAHARKKGRIHRGGGRRFRPMQNDIERFLRQESGRDVYFTTMVDLYALPNDFPGLDEADRVRHVPRDRVRLLEDSWRNETGDGRFVPFIALHEFESYLFSDVSKFDEFFDGADRGMAELQRVVDGVTSPELIDNGQHTAPSKRIISQFPEYDSLKSSVGPQMAELIGLTTIRSKCPHFDAWIRCLEQLGT